MAGMDHLLLPKQLNRPPCMWALAARASLICLRINHPLERKARRSSWASGPAFALPSPCQVLGAWV